MTKKPTPEVSHSVRTLRLKVKAESYAWLNAAAAEVNQVWNWANATAFKAARPFAGAGKWLSAYDLDKLSAGAGEVAPLRERERVFAVCDRAAPGTSPAQGRD
jgi:hypothetical protein